MKNSKKLIYVRVYLITFLSMILFSSCSNYLKAIKTSKTKHISGLPNGKDYVDYKFEVNSKSDFNFESLELNNTKITESLYIKDLSTGLSSTKINSNIKKGAYLFGFRSYNIGSFNKEETITFNYLINNKKLQLKKQVKTKTQTNK